MHIWESKRGISQRQLPMPPKALDHTAMCLLASWSDHGFVLGFSPLCLLRFFSWTLHYYWFHLLWHYCNTTAITESAALVVECLRADQPGKQKQGGTPTSGAPRESGRWLAFLGAGSTAAFYSASEQTSVGGYAPLNVPAPLKAARDTS